MNYIVFDLEWNQCPQGKARENPRLPFEIVEIGAIKLNENLEEIGRFHELIRPLVYHRLHRKTQEVIHLDDAALAHKRTFSPVIRDFFKWCGEDFEFVTWGSLDLTELQRNMDYYRIQNPLPLPLYYYDLQKMFSLLYDDGKSRSSLEDAVEFLKVPKDHAFHRAFDDTFYTAEIMKRMDMKSVCRYESVDYHRLPQDRAAEIEIDFGTYRKYVSREFQTKEDVLADKKVTSMRCVRCGLPVFKRVKWFSAGANMYLCLVQCPRHGYTKGKIRLKKAADGGHFAVKTIKAADAESVRSIKEKQETVKEKRKERRHRKNENKRMQNTFMLLLLILAMSVMTPGRAMASAADPPEPQQTQEAQQTETQPPADSGTQPGTEPSDSGPAEEPTTAAAEPTTAAPEPASAEETQAPPAASFKKTEITLSLGKKYTLRTVNMPEGCKITGYESSKPDIVSVSSKGKIKALQSGKAAVRAGLSNGQTIKTVVTVPPVTISKTQLILVKGTEKKLALKGSGIPGSWKSSKKKVAALTLDKTTGRVTVTAKKYGTALITAKAGNMQFTCEVTVVDPTLSRTSVTLLAGDSYQLKAEKYTGSAKWSVKNSKVAKVSSSGRITARKAGKTKIIFRANKTDIICRLRVLSGGLASGNISMTEGETSQVQLRGKAVPDSYSSENEKIASVSQNGVITAVSSGETKIYAHYGQSVRSCYVAVDKKEGHTLFGQTVAQRKAGISSIRDRYLGSDSEYRIMQGACTDGKYAYFILGNQGHKASCALIKARLSDWKPVKIETGLPLGHGNDITYDSRRRQLVAVHSSWLGKSDGHVVSLISPKKLLVKKTVTLEERVYSVAYSQKRDQFVFGVSDTDTAVIKDSSFKTVKTFPLLHKGAFTRQGMDADEKAIYVVQSNLSAGMTRVMVYSWRGVYYTTVYLKGKREAESMFHVRNKFFITYNSASFNGGQVYETAMRHYYQVKYVPGDGTGSVRYKMVKNGNGFVCAKNRFKNEGYELKGYTLYRTSDGKACYRHKNTKKVRWFDSGEQPDGYRLYVAKAGKQLKPLSDVPGDCIVMTAVWKLKKQTSDSKG